MNRGKANVNTPDAAYQRQAPRWRPIDALRGGTPAMRAAAEEFAPRFSMESNAVYDERLKQAVLYPAYETTVDVLSRKPTAKPVSVEGATGVLDEIERDVDLDGRDLTAFASDLIADVLDFGRAQFLVEMPATVQLEQDLGRSLTEADARRFNLRPYFAQVSPRDTIGRLGGSVGGVESLRRLRIRESIEREAGDWETASTRRVRVITPEDIVVYVETAPNSDEWQPEAPLPNQLGRIALVTIYGRRKGLLESWPVLEGLAHLNIAHWQSYSDQRNILHVARAPFLFGAGFTEDEFKRVAVGPNLGVRASNPSTALRYVEPEGTAIAAGEKDLERLKEEMASIGLDMLIRRPGAQTATEVAVDTAEEVSKLHAITRRVEAGLEQGYALAAGWLVAGNGPGAIDRAVRDSAVDVTIDNSFGYSLRDEGDLKIVLEARKMGDLSRLDFLEELKRRSILDHNADPAQLAAAANDDDPFRGVSPDLGGFGDDE